MSSDFPDENIVFYVLLVSHEEAFLTEEVERRLYLLLLTWDKNIFQWSEYVDDVASSPLVSGNFVSMKRSSIQQLISNF